MTTPQELQSALTTNPAITNAAQSALSSGCGIGGALSEIRSAINSATTAINDAIQTATDIVTFVQNLPSLMAAQVSAVISSALSNVLGPVQALVNQAQVEIATLISLINDPIGFLSQYIRIQLLFPNLDLEKMINDLISGVSVCQASAAATATPAEHPPSNQLAQAAPEPTPIPQAPVVEVSPNSSTPAQTRIIREELAASPPAATPATTTTAEQDALNFRLETAQLRIDRQRLGLQLAYTESPEIRERLSGQMQELQNQIDARTLSSESVR